MAGDEAEQDPEVEVDELKVMKELVQKLLSSSIEAQQRADKMADENAKLIDALNNRGGDAGPTRPEKLSKLGLALRKSYKVKEFKEAQECTVKEWLKRFDQEVVVLKKMSGLDGDLTNIEKVELLKDKLEYSVIQRLNTKY